MSHYQTLKYQDNTPDRLYLDWIQQTSYSAGLDLMAAEAVTIEPGRAYLIKTGVQVVIPDKHVGILAARSSTFHKFGLLLTNGMGIIDSDYRGELLASFFNQHSSAVHIPRGTRLAQLLILPYVHAITHPVKIDTEGTARGAGGFGSTG